MMASSCETAAQTIERPLDPPRSPRPRIDFPSDPGAPTGCSTLAALAGAPLLSRFCSWVGRSGRRYIFSIYPASACPAYCDAILLAAVRDEGGRRRIVSIRDTGAFPEPLVARTERELRGLGRGLEFHLHLLASSPAERAATLADLAAATT